MWIRRATPQRHTYRQLPNGSSASIWRNFELARTGWQWKQVVLGRQGWSESLGLCQRCEGSSVDDVEHMVYGCSSLAAERQKHQSLFARGRVALADFSSRIQSSWLHLFTTALRHAMSRRSCGNSVCCERLVLGAFTNLHLARRSVVGYLKRSMLASNRLCNTSIMLCNIYIIYCVCWRPSR